MPARSSTIHSRIACLIAIGVIAVSGCIMPGQRLLTVRVERDGEVVLNGMFGASDSLGPRKTWSRMKNVSLESTEAFEKLQPSSTTTRLTGKIRIVLQHTDRTFASATTMQLDVVPDPAHSGQWLIAPAEVDRTVSLVNE